MKLRNRLLAAFVALLLGCDAADNRPIDGGLPLDFDRSPHAEALMEKDPCWRREKGGWHLSIGHCEAMTPPSTMSGVWVTAFEETSFFPNRTAIPDAHDPLRFTQEIELDADAVRKLAGSPPNSPNGDAFLLTFVGRRTRDPIFVNCGGYPYFGVVVDHIVSARYLGAMGEWDRNKFFAQPDIVTVRHKGRWGELEAEAVKRCFNSKSRAAQD